MDVPRIAVGAGRALVTCLCADCGGILPMGEDDEVPFALHMGHLYAFCSVECQRHWLDDSQEGAELKEMLG